jgi:hypothetical protein
MILLLQGSTDLGRVALAEKITEKHDQWRHLPIEGVAEIGLIEMPEGAANETILVTLACHLAREMQEQKFNVILSYEDLTNHLGDLKEELGDDLISVHLENDAEYPQGFDHVLDAKKKSVNELYEEIAGIIGA